MGKYDDIIHLPRPASARAKMSRVDRGAQFAPFAALPGFDQELKRKTQEEQDHDAALRKAGPGPDPGDD